MEFSKLTYEYIGEEIHIYDRILSILDTPGILDPFTKRFLLELQRMFPGEHWEIVNRIDGILNESINRRKSRLNNPHTWIELNLPKGLNELIDV